MTQIADVISQLGRLYDDTVETLRADILAFAETGAIPAIEKRLDGSYCYPELRIHFAGEGKGGDPARAFGRLQTAGTYATTITRPALFDAYLTEQLELIAEDYTVTFEV